MGGGIPIGGIPIGIPIPPLVLPPPPRIMCCGIGGAYPGRVPPYPGGGGGGIVPGGGGGAPPVGGGRYGGTPVGGKGGMVGAGGGGGGMPGGSGGSGGTPLWCEARYRVGEAEEGKYESETQERTQVASWRNGAKPQAIHSKHGILLRRTFLTRSINCIAHDSYKYRLGWSDVEENKSEATTRYPSGRLLNTDLENIPPELPAQEGQQI